MITLGTLVVSDEDLAIIAHVVHNETPEQWATRSFNHLGKSSVISKIARHRASYLAAKDTPGYQTAAQRMTERRDAAEAQAAAEKQVRDAARASRLQRLRAASTHAQLLSWIEAELV